MSSKTCAPLPDLPPGHISWRVSQDIILGPEETLNVEDLVIENVGLGLTIWEGEFEYCHEWWLRWCDHNGIVIPTGRERAEQESQRAEYWSAQRRSLNIPPGE
jgi:hypothetical protein